MNTPEGARKAANTMKERYGTDYYRSIGEKGGKAKVPKGFALNPERARKAGAIGGKKSSRKGVKNKSKRGKANAR